jgi:uncharacterized protein with PhoU and TrkA domain
MTETCDLKDLLASMKDLSELAVDLSYTALLFDSKEIAHEVQELEEEMDDLYYRSRLAVLEMAKSEEPRPLLSLLAFIDAVEDITDAANEVSEIVMEGIDPHPVFDIAMRDTDEVISRVDVEPGSILIDRKLAELKLETKVGVDILAIKRSGKLIYDPGDQDVLKRGDILIVKGSEDGIEKLRGISGEDEEEEEEELTLDE